MRRDWIRYAVVAAIPVALAVGLWFFSVWFGGRAPRRDSASRHLCFVPKSQRRIPSDEVGDGDANSIC